MSNVGNDESIGLSYALRFLIHYVGDIHQPLHCMNRVDKSYPAGDKGGNDFPLPNHYDANELHAVWDSVIYEFHTNDKLVSFDLILNFIFQPYTSATWSTLGSHASTLANSYSIASSDYQNLNFATWT